MSEEGELEAGRVGVPGKAGKERRGQARRTFQAGNTGGHCWKKTSVGAGRASIPAGGAGRQECRVFQAGRGRNAKGQGNAPRNARGPQVRLAPPTSPPARLAWHFHLLLSRRRHARTAPRTPDYRNTITSCGDRPVRQTGAWHQPDDAGDISTAVTPR